MARSGHPMIVGNVLPTSGSPPGTGTTKGSIRAEVVFDCSTHTSCADISRAVSLRWWRPRRKRLAACRERSHVRLRRVTPTRSMCGASAGQRSTGIARTCRSCGAAARVSPTAVHGTPRRHAVPRGRWGSTHIGCPVLTAGRAGGALDHRLRDTDGVHVVATWVPASRTAASTTGTSGQPRSAATWGDCGGSRRWRWRPGRFAGCGGGGRRRRFWPPLPGRCCRGGRRRPRPKGVRCRNR
jgi:hypothetical protein